MHFPQRTSGGCKILRGNKYGAAVDFSEARHHAVGGNIFFVQAEQRRSMFNKKLHFLKGVLIKK